MKLALYWPGVTKHLIALTIGWFMFSVLLGLFYAFDAMEATTEIPASTAIQYFLKVAAITFFIGSIALTLPVIIWKLLDRNNT
jgi:hypothetical protein